MPVTRRKRANPPEEPEQNNNHASEKEQNEQAVETPATATPEAASTPAPLSETEQPASLSPAEPTQSAAQPAQEAEQPVEAPRQEEKPPVAPAPPIAPIAPVAPAAAAPLSANGDRTDRHEYTPPPVEGVRRPVREAFRRPSHMQQVPQQPVQATPPPPPPAAPAPLQPPTHEIALPLGNLLHLAYNPGYTGSDEARSALLTHLARESKSGGRARCWNCGSVAIVYERWNTRSKTFGEIGIAFCEICGVWSVM